MHRASITYAAASASWGVWGTARPASMMVAPMASTMAARAGGPAASRSSEISAAARASGRSSAVTGSLTAPMPSPRKASEPMICTHSRVAGGSQPGTSSCVSTTPPAPASRRVWDASRTSRGAASYSSTALSPSPTPVHVHAITAPLARAAIACGAMLCTTAQAWDSVPAVAPSLAPPRAWNRWPPASTATSSTSGFSPPRGSGKRSTASLASSSASFTPSKASPSPMLSMLARMHPSVSVTRDPGKRWCTLPT
mmetsp:Transcript_57816/g.183347  ORF Transcript_57816/g.183347 Transcript_57816/m.183347 type:complete len:254 (+) Transcript_57816:1157-1918(+)